MRLLQELLNVEIAQRTKDTPPALQYENTAPYDYFNRLVAGFEAQMGHYRYVCPRKYYNTVNTRLLNSYLMFQGAR